MTSQRSRRLELTGLPRDVALRGPDLCALRCHARAHSSCWSSGLLVGDEPRVGDLGLLGEPALGLTDREVAAPDPARGPSVLRAAGGDLQPAQLLLGQRRLL